MKKESIYRVLQFGLWISVGITIPVVIDLHGSFGNELWIVVLPLLAIAVAQAITGLYIWIKQRPNGVRKLPRPRRGSGWRVLLWQLILCAVLSMLASRWSLTEFGMKHFVHPAFAFVIGFVCYLLYSKLYQLVAINLVDETSLQDKSFNTMRNLWPSTVRDKQLFWVAVCLLNPVTEEFVYRGVLFFALGTLLDSFALAATISISLSLAVHSYQGVFHLPFHLGFSLLACVLMLSPLGLFACIGLHFAGDIIPISSIRTEWEAWLQRNRRSSVENSPSSLQTK